LPENHPNPCPARIRSPFDPAIPREEPAIIPVYDDIGSEKYSKSEAVN
jgi:hypothetical protein